MARKLVNPFYVLLMVVGVIFAISACAYGVMAVKLAQPEASEAAAASSFVVWMDRHGTTLLLVELAVLAVTTFAAIGTDDYWSRRAADSEASSRRTPSRGDSEEHTASSQG